MSAAQYQRQLQEAVVHHRAGRLDQAGAIYRRVRAALPNHFDAVHLSGIVAQQQGRTAEALDLLTRAHRLGPKNAPCALRLGHAFIAAGRIGEAEPVIRSAVALDEQAHEGWETLAYCLKLQDKLPAAMGCHRRAVTLQPKFAKGWYNYGLTLSLSGRYAVALQCHEQAIAADPAYPKGWYGRAQALHQLHRLPEAVAAYEKFLELEPASHEARSYRLFALNHTDGLSREQLFAEHVAFGRAVGSQPVPDFPNPAVAGRRLRVAVFSPDLRAHSCAYFLEPLLRHLDPASFELYLYHDHFREDAVSMRLKAFAAVWRNFVGQPAEAVEKTIRADQPDLLIDLAGHTGMTCRLPLFAKHLAPVQINYLGYPNTTGLPAMHYRFTDSVVDPVGAADALATEKLVRFAPTAWAYEPPAGAPEPGPAPCIESGQACPEPGRWVTFGCFNNVAKISDTTLALWARVLAAVPGAKLLLKGRGLGDPAMRQRYLDRLTANGLPADRVEFLERTATTEDHLALYRRVDISLDTFPYHGTTTTCEALWMGVPVVTLMGDRHVSRVSGSLLTAIGRTEWIAASADDYVRIATQLANDPVALSVARAGLREQVGKSSLGDHAGQAACFTTALRQCWQNYCITRLASPQPAKATAGAQHRAVA